MMQRVFGREIRKAVELFFDTHLIKNLFQLYESHSMIDILHDYDPYF